MILFTYSIVQIGVAILLVSMLVFLFIVLVKRKQRLNAQRKELRKKFVELHTLETQPSSGEIKFFYETEGNHVVRLELLNLDYSLNRLIDERDATSGGHIIPFDTAVVENGEYFYQISTEHQKTTKRIKIQN